MFRPPSRRNRPDGGSAPRPGTSGPPLRYRWRVLAWRLRRPLAAALLGCAAALALAQLRPPSPLQATVVVAARPLDAGARLTEDDLRLARVPPDVVTHGSHAARGPVVGRALVVGVPAGLPIVDALLGDGRLAAAGPPGTVVVPVRLADPGVAALLRPGDRVDLVAAATSALGEPVTTPLAQRAVVVPRPVSDGGSDAGTSGLLGAPSTAQDGDAITLVAVPPEQASALAGASGWAGISAVLVE